MNTLATILAISSIGGIGIKQLIIAALVIGAAIWLIFYVLPLPQVVRTILAIAIAVLIIFWLIPG